MVKNSQLKYKLFYEFIWLIGIIAVSAVIEYTIITFFDLHPILSVKIQGLIGLMIIAYGVRMITRMGQKGIIPLVDEDDNGSTKIE